MFDGGWYYFGCDKQAGHHAFDEGRRRPPYERAIIFSHLDGTLPPQPEGRNLYVASFSRLGGWNMTALSWWDRSVDSRPGSNSTILAPGLTIAPVEMLDEAHQATAGSRRPASPAGCGSGVATRSDRNPVRSPHAHRPHN